MMARMAVCHLLFTGFGCSAGPDPRSASTMLAATSIVHDSTDPLADADRTIPTVWITSPSTLEGLVRASRDNTFEPELPIKIKGAHVDFRGIQFDTASVHCKSIGSKLGCFVALLELKDATGSRFWSVSTYDTAFTYLESLVVEEHRASASPKVMFLVGQITYYGGNYPLDYQIRHFDPEDSLTGHPDLYDARKVVGISICEDGSIKCCTIPAKCFRRTSEKNMVVPDTCTGC